MLIVVEGCDGVGKTTLAEALVERLGRGAELRHLGPPVRHPLEECVLDLDDYRPGVGRHVVVDRLHLGELIYGPIYRGESRLGRIDGPGHRWVDAWLRSVGALVVHVDAELETVLARIDVRGDDYVKVEHLERILNEYRHAFRVSTTTRRATQWPPTPDTPSEAEAAVEGLVQVAAMLEKKAARSPLAGHRFVGDPTPEVILVGDEPSPRHQRGDRPTYRGPFVPYRDGCGWFLFGALTAGTLKTAAVVNSVDVDAAMLAALDDYRHRCAPAWVALGRKASLRLKGLGVPHAAVPHPQFVRRFHHEQLEDYGQLIAGVRGVEVDMVGAYHQLRENAR